MGEKIIEKHILKHAGVLEGMVVKLLSKPAKKNESAV